MSFCSRYLFLLLSVSVFLFLGCNSAKVPGGNKAVTKSNLAKIVNDMSVADVEAILGSSETVANGSATVNRARVECENHLWRNGESVITVSFVAGKVVATSGANL